MIRHTPRLTRRQLLQVGGVGVLGLGLPALLRADGRGPARSCIFTVQYGGMSHIDSWDLKPDAPETIRGPYQPIASRTPGLRVCELMPRLASLSDRYCIVRSMTHGNGGHD